MLRTSSASSAVSCVRAWRGWFCAAARRADAAHRTGRSSAATPRLTGVATAAPPATLALKWTYEAGESIESSAAIADGAVYVGSAKGELLALDLETGKLRWKYATGANGFIGESSPAVSDGAVFVGDLAGIVHAVDRRRTASKLWTFKTDGEIEVVAGARRRPRADRLVRHAPLRARAPHRQAALEAADRRPGARDAGGARTASSTSPAATSSSARCASPTARCCSRFRSAPYTGASTAIDGDRAYVGTFDADVLALDLKTRKVAWRYRDPERAVPVLLVAARTAPAARGDRRRPRQGGPRDRRRDRQGGLEVRDARARRFVAGARRRARLRRIERRQALRARRGDRREAVGVRRRRRDHRLARDRRRPRRRRRARTAGSTASGKIDQCSSRLTTRRTHVVSDS